jgi:hypothetical protein
MAGYIGSKASVVSSGVEHKKTFTITGATTSLTGLNYTVGKVHVFQNGVRLVDGTDYTATNSTTITLTVAAQSGDNVVVISQADFQVSGAVSTSGGTMTGDLTVQGAFTSQGIDDNADAVAMTITSDETVLIGKNTTAIGTAGHRINGLGYHYATRAMGSNGTDPVFIANILNNDGNAIEIYKDSNKVGGTGVVGGNDLFIAGGATGIRFDSDVAKIYPTNGTGAVSNGAVDIGEANFRFKDAYLSGGVYLGGTAAANKLDDFEQGTFNLTLRSDGSEPSTKVTVPCNYIKVGNTVNFWGTQASINNTAYSGGMRFEGLPFAAPSPYSIGNIAIDNMGNYSGSYGPYTMISGTIVYAVRHMSNATSWNFVQHNSTTTGGVYLSGAYIIS